jgi:putative cell wall-binding protein/Tol biopolymer transport system component
LVYQLGWGAVMNTVFSSSGQQDERRKRRGFTIAAAIAVLGVIAGAAGASVSYAAAPPPGTTIMISTDPSGLPFDGASSQPVVSADGRFVAFTSNAYRSNPLAGEFQVYVRDVATGVVSLVSSRGEGEGPANGDSFEPSISADGRYVAYGSMATDLDPLTRRGGRHIYVRDLAEAGRTRLASVNSRGTAGGNGASSSPSISGDGRTIAYQSQSNDLVADLNPLSAQIYQVDLAVEGVLRSRLVSVQSGSRADRPVVANLGATDPSSSHDGSVVAFTSRSTNLTNDAPNERQHVFAHAMVGGATTLVSAGASERVSGNRDSGEPSISGDGTTVVYTSKASNLTEGAAGTSETVSQIFQRSLTGPRSSSLVSVNAAGTAPAGQSSSAPSLSLDGTAVAYVTAATDAVEADFRSMPQAVHRDLVKKVTTLVSAELGAPLRGAATGASEPSIADAGRYVAFISDSSGLSPESPISHREAFLRGMAGATPVSSVIERIGGADRFAVSAGLSAQKFSSGVPVAYVASGVVFPDALSGSAAAGLGGGPVLLVRNWEVPAVVAAELKRLAPGRIVILGGTATVSPVVQTTLAEFVGKDPAKVTRIAGTDRYDVSAEVSKVTFRENVDVAYVASGEVFPDALSGSAAAGLKQGPVLLVTKGGVPEKVAAELARLKPKVIVVLGGTSTIADSVVTELAKTVPATTRVAGADRFVVSSEIAKASFLSSGGTVYVASGQVFPDALSGSAAAIGAAAPVLLVTADSIPPTVAAQLTRLAPTRIVVLGGEATVSAPVYESLRGYLAK